MVSFMEKHAAECSICQNDPDVLREIAKITEHVLPESKIPKATRLKREQQEMEKQRLAAEMALENNQSSTSNDDSD